MAHLSAHLWSAAILAAAATVALAADRLAGDPAFGRRASPAVPRGDDIARFVRAPVRGDSALPQFRGVIFSDPFGTRAAESGVSRPAVVAAAPVAPRRLTAILITDDRRVAVIDDSTVSVGDVLRDGARVSAIHADRVWVVDAAGQWRALMLLEPGR